MPSTSQILKQKSLVLIFTYAPAGLGHLRVTDALYAGLPQDTQSHLMGSQDSGIMVLHRIFSIHPLLRKLFEWVQDGPQQYIFSWFYKKSNRIKAKLMYEQLVTILDQRIDTPSTVLIVATHFSLAHQIGEIKAKLEKARKVKIILAVQVTDDSPQFMWFIPEADITFVPSAYTKKELEKYGEWVGFGKGNFVVNPYPVNPVLARRLNPVEYHEKEHQLDPEAKSQIHVAIPVSGAAVGLEYAKGIVDHLHKQTHRFLFHVVTRTAPYTLTFLNDMIQRPYVKVYVHTEDRDVVNAYEHIYLKYRISLEVTKPSEQAFKTLLYPQHLGGSLLLFSEPVGRQEYDNINFMHRHNLIPNKKVQEQLWGLAKNSEKPTAAIMESVREWRGMILPNDPEQAGCYIWWCLENKLFEKMMQYRVLQEDTSASAAELSPYGVAEFWDKLSEFIEK